MGICVGDKVMLHIDEKKRYVPKDLQNESDKIHIVSGTKLTIKPNAAGNAAYIWTYELAGLKSKFGIPWMIDADWLTPIEE